VALQDLVREARDGAGDCRAVEDDLARLGHSRRTRKSPPDLGREGFRTSEDRTWRGSPDRPFLTSRGQIKRYEGVVRRDVRHVKLDRVFRRISAPPYAMTPAAITRKDAAELTELRLDRWLWAARFF